MAPLSPRKTAVAAGVTEQGTAVLERAAQVLALGGRFSAWKMLVQVNAADTFISARCIFCCSNYKDECLGPRLRPARLDKPMKDACLYKNYEGIHTNNEGRLYHIYIHTFIIHIRS